MQTTAKYRFFTKTPRDSRGAKAVTRVSRRRFSIRERFAFSVNLITQVKDARRAKGRTDRVAASAAA